MTTLDLRGGRLTSDVALVVCQFAAELFAQKPLRSLDLRGVHFDDEWCVDADEQLRILREALNWKDIELLL